MATKPRDLTDIVDGDVDRLVLAYSSESGAVRAAKGPVRASAAVWLLAALFLSLLVVAATFKVDRIVEGTQGILVTVKPNLSLQAFDSWSVKSVDVQDGQFVTQGQLLLTLDPTFANADTMALQAQVSSLKAQIARNEAELSGEPLNFPREGDAPLNQYQTLQIKYYSQRQAQYNQQLKAFDAQIAEANATIEKLKSDVARQTERGTIASQIEKMWSGLQARDAGSLLQTLNAKDVVLQINKDIEASKNGIVEAQHRLESVTASREAFVQSWLGQSSQELVTARNTLDSATEQLAKATRRSDFVRLMAPEDSMVLNMPKLSVGSVIRQGETMVVLAPMSAPLEAEIGISPRDIGFVRPGDPVTLKLDAFPFVDHGEAEGRIRWISEGTFAADTQSGTAITSTGAAQGAYYKARVEIVERNFRNVPAQFRLLPGMTLAAEIHVGERRLINYLMRGLIRTGSEAMREPQ